MLFDKKTEGDGQSQAAPIAFNRRPVNGSTSGNLLYIYADWCVILLTPAAHPWYGLAGFALTDGKNGRTQGTCGNSGRRLWLGLLTSVVMILVTGIGSLTTSRGCRRSLLKKVRVETFADVSRRGREGALFFATIEADSSGDALVFRWALVRSIQDAAGPNATRKFKRDSKNRSNLSSAHSRDQAWVRRGESS